MGLKLTLPDHAEVQDPRVLFGQRDLKDWVTQLPMADMEAAGQALLESLTLFNRQPVAFTLRFELLEIYRAAALPIMEALENRVSNATQRTTRAVHAAELVHLLVRELGYGYKDVANDASADGGNSKSPALGGALVRSLEYLVYAMRLHFQSYRACPDNLREEINQIFSFAEHAGLTEAELNDGQDDRKNISVSALFKTSILLQLADPHHLQRGDARAIHRLLLALARLAIITRTDGIMDEPGRFVTSLNLDSPPMPYGEDRFEPDDDGLRLLLTEDLIDHLRQIIDDVSEDHELMPYELAIMTHPRRADSLALLRRLARFWWKKPKRRHERNMRHGWLDVTYGIAATHFYLNNKKALNETDFAWAANEDAEQDEIEIGSKLGGEQASQNAASYPTHRCELVNHSPGGIAITVNPKEADLRIGQIIGFSQNGSTDGAEWFIGVVRWFSQLNDEVMRAGVQHLASGAAPIAVHGIRRNKATHKLQPALLISNLTRLRGDALVVSHGIFAKGQDIAVLDSQQRQKATVADIVDSSGSFDLIRFEKQGS